jgi:signal transduction histidine kinase
MGLGSMEERVSLLGGDLRIQSRLMQGTKIRIEIPLQETAGE